MEEKRRLRRRSLAAEVGLKPVGEKGWTEGVLMNINRGGIGVYTGAELKKKSRVVVRVSFRENGKRVTTEEIPGIIKWVARVGNQFGAGIMFLDRINRRNFPTLSRCLDLAKMTK